MADDLLSPGAGPSSPVVPEGPEGVRDMTPEEINIKRDAARQASAESISPGCAQWSIPDWTPKERKPQLDHLLKVMQTRFPGAKFKNWPAQRIAHYLHDNPIPVCP